VFTLRICQYSPPQNQRKEFKTPRPDQKKPFRKGKDQHLIKEDRSFSTSSQQSFVPCIIPSFLPELAILLVFEAGGGKKKSNSNFCSREDRERREEVVSELSLFAPLHSSPTHSQLTSLLPALLTADSTILLYNQQVYLYNQASDNVR